MYLSTIDKNAAALEEAYGSLGMVPKRPESYVFKAVSKFKEGSLEITQVTILDRNYAIFESAMEYRPSRATPEEMCSWLATYNESIAVGYFSYDVKGYLKYRISCLLQDDPKTAVELAGYIRICLQSLDQIVEEIGKNTSLSAGDRWIANEGQIYLPRRDYVDNMIR